MAEKIKIDNKTTYHFLNAYRVVKTGEWNYSIRPCRIAFNTHSTDIVAVSVKHTHVGDNVSLDSWHRHRLGGFGKKEQFENNYRPGQVHEYTRDFVVVNRYALFKTAEEAEKYAYESGIMESKLKHEQKEIENLKSRWAAKVKETDKILTAIERAKKLA